MGSAFDALLGAGSLAREGSGEPHIACHFGSDDRLLVLDGKVEVASLERIAQYVDHFREGLLLVVHVQDRRAIAWRVR